MMRLLTIAVITAAIAISGCNNTTTGPGGGGEVTIDNPLPLSVGNWWGYVNYEETAKGDTTRDTLRIVGTDVVNGKNVYVVTMKNDEGQLDTMYAYRDGDYIYLIQRMVGDSLVTTKFLKVPLSTGDSWTVFTLSDSSMSITVNSRVVGSSDVSVPAGNFSGVAEVEQQFIWSYSYGGASFSDTSYNYYYIANNVGVVQIEDTGDSTTSVSKLEGYHIE